MSLEQSLTVIFRNVNNTQRLIGDMQRGFGETIRIAAMPTLANTFLPQAIAEVSAKSPKLRFVLKSLEPTPMESRLTNGDYNFCLTQTQPRRPQVEFEPILTTSFVCVIHRDHPLAKRRRIDPPDLRSEVLISFSERVAHGRSLDTVFEDSDTERRVGVQTTSSALAVRLVESGYGIALIDPFAIDRIDDSRVVVRAMTERQPIELGFIYMTGRQFEAGERQLMKAIRKSALEWEERIRATWGSAFFPPATTQSGTAKVS
ncbi:LysR substrate-binding domain-containing protein [Pseudaestuariivita rosea]|uniref:LysR substrate-binding domain-containing protein n=1 Tax=Pseudaestuariivita rosea TaxID=2763263 RepID=UPI001F3652FC|nr:LysR substrate-binding domain-containing protein [Pseudaestuariivita rosea]